MQGRSPRGPLLRFAGLLVLAAALAGGGCRGSGSANNYDTGRLGQITLERPAGPMRGLVFLFSSRADWQKSDRAVAQRLRAAGASVVGVDLDAYVAALDRDDGQCLYLLSEVESLSEQVQRSLGTTSYRSPIVAGRGEAGTLVMAMLAQSPAATVAGAVAVDPAPTLATRLPLCAGAPSHRKGGGFQYGGVASLPGFLALGLQPGADSKGATHAEHVASASGVRIELDRRSPTPGAAAGARKPDPSAAGTDRAREVQADPGTDALEQLVLAHLPAQAEATGSLPPWVVDLPASRPGERLAVILSGDGGWRDLDKTIAEQLQARGVDVLGWDSLRYFWTARTPDQLASDLDALLRPRLAGHAGTQVLLVGYSFGADVLPFAWNRMADDTRSRVRQLSLLGVSHSADFEFHVTGWLGATTADAPPTAPELARIPAPLLQCFHGEDDEDSVCPALAERGAEVIRTSGSHHFDGDYAALAARILEGAERRAAAGSPAGR